LRKKGKRKALIKLIADVLLALWDGTYNGKKGGKSDVVAYAKSQNYRVEHILSKHKNN